MKYIASCSFGKDSLAMVLLLIEKNLPLDEVVFYDTGMEFQAIYNNRDKLVPILKSHGIKYTELKPDRPFLYDMLKKPIIRNKERSCDRCKFYKIVSSPSGICNNPQSEFYQKDDECGGGLPSEKSPYSKGSCKLLELKRHTKHGYGWCGGNCRWGTTFKNSTIESYLKTLNDEVCEYIGIAFDEPDRIKQKHYPLFEWCMTEKDCLDYCRERGWNWLEESVDGTVDLYDILDRVSCWCCANKNLKELRNIYLFLPQYWERLKVLQYQIAKPMKRYSKKGVPYGDVFQLEEFFKREESMKALSLFDGISCGMVSIERSKIEHFGDVTTADFTQFKGFDLLIGGSPCTSWSIAKKNRETTEKVRQKGVPYGNVFQLKEVFKESNK